ncbi:MAG: amidohydrolase family protein [Clostridia bacterium]|nr:amidohydrolase family protein [Clostridia bacterium]
MLAIVNAYIVKPDHIIPDGVILCRGKKIVYAGPKKPLPENCEIIDAKGNFAGPGLIDIHTHAAGSYWYYNEPEKAARITLAHGTTSVYPTLYYDLDQKQYIESAALNRKVSKKGAGRVIRGLYMEGPYLNPKFGANQSGNVWKGPIKKEEYMPIIEAAADFAQFWSVAPERPGVKGFVSDVRRANPNIVFTVAHSEAAPSDIEELIPLGLKIGTHHTNATGDRPKYPEVRGVCVDETVNSRDEIYAEIISDSKGIHVDPYMQRLILKIKGKDKIILISDACVFDGPVPGEGYEGVTDINFDWDGQIAGSKLTLDVACRNFMMHTGSSICDVFRFASLNPARAMGDLSRGHISEGADADMIIVDGFMKVKKVILQGELQKI